MRADKPEDGALVKQKTQHTQWPSTYKKKNENKTKKKVELFWNTFNTAATKQQRSQNESKTKIKKKKRENMEGNRERERGGVFFNCVFLRLLVFFFFSLYT